MGGVSFPVQGGEDGDQASLRVRSRALRSVVPAPELAARHPRGHRGARGAGSGHTEHTSFRTVPCSCSLGMLFYVSRLCFRM